MAEFASRLRDLPGRRLAQQAQEAAESEAERSRQQLARERARRPWVAAAVFALAAGLVAALWLYQGQRRAREDLARQLNLVQALNGVLTEDLIGAASGIMWLGTMCPALPDPLPLPISFASSRVTCLPDFKR